MFQVWISVPPWAACPEERQHPGDMSTGYKSPASGKHCSYRCTQGCYRPHVPKQWSKIRTIQFRMLRDFDASEQRKTRSDKVVSEVLGTFGASLSSPFRTNNMWRCNEFILSRRILNENQVVSFIDHLIDKKWIRFDMTFTITSSVTSQVVIAHLLRNTISFRHSGQFCRGGFPRIFRLNTAERITRKCISQIGPITGLPYHS